LYVKFHVYYQSNTLIKIMYIFSTSYIQEKGKYKGHLEQKATNNMGNCKYVCSSV
jgi:hypothetical protein